MNYFILYQNTDIKSKPSRKEGFAQKRKNRKITQYYTMPIIDFEIATKPKAIIATTIPTIA